VTSEAEPSAPARILAPEHRSLTVGLLAVVSLVAFEAMAVATAMPVAVRDLGGLRLYAWSFSAFFTTSLVGMVLAGDLSDRRGPLWPFVNSDGSSNAKPTWRRSEVTVRSRRSCPSSVTRPSVGS
jgi:hypothetical protein